MRHGSGTFEIFCSDVLFWHALLLINVEPLKRDGQLPSVFRSFCILLTLQLSQFPLALLFLRHSLIS